MIEAVGKNIFDQKTGEAIAKKARYLPRKIIELCESHYLQNAKGSKRSPARKFSFKKKSSGGITNEKLPPNPRDYAYQVDDIGQKRLTLRQKKVITELEKGHRTVEEIAQGAEVPPKEIESELQKLFYNGMIKVAGKVAPSTDHQLPAI